MHFFTVSFKNPNARKFLTAGRTLGFHDLRRSWLFRTAIGFIFCRSLNLTLVFIACTYQRFIIIVNKSIKQNDPIYNFVFLSPQLKIGKIRKV